MAAKSFDELVKQARANLMKSAFVPMTGQGPSQPAPGPADGTGGPPMMPAGGAAMPPPAPAGGDPNAAGGDPNAAAGGAQPPPGQGGQMQAGMDPTQPVQLTMNDLVQLVQMVSSGGAQPAPQPAEGGDKGGAGGGKSKGGKANVENELRDIRHSIERLVAAITGDPSGGAAMAQSAGITPPPAAAGQGGDQLGLAGGGDPASMGQGVDPNSAPPEPEVPGQPAGAPPGMGAPGGMQVQASAKTASSKQLSRIIANLKRT